MKKEGKKEKEKVHVCDNVLRNISHVPTWNSYSGISLGREANVWDIFPSWFLW